MEKLDLDKAQQIERLYATPPVYEWELIVNTISFRTKMMYIMLLGSFGVGIMFFLIGFSWLSLVPIVVGSFLTPWFRYLVNSDKRYYYAINQYGMYSTEEQIIPEIAYTIVRYSAWVGCGICLFAAILIGPIAFVGAGGAALLSFQMTNFRSVPYKTQRLFDGYIKLEYFESCKAFINTKETFFICFIPKEKVAEIESVLIKLNDTFEKEFIDDFADATRFQAFPVILEIVR
ncbi:hypothetical protein [Photobacterium damselae]|uniref:hypothetical protein n=1 Tax=Photobacterium damselae TaxID=38293 RepID=UPI000D668F64|nr:hypothetical protein [Photobacterium damselae]AWK83753.1 hypothetical protein BST98_17235 [Photobacterium damselae]NVO72442.1 hypothetical protein [Photobacterium damselae subsp. damselae]SPY29836.1 Uncharacterised protein [Photobacterium damselae]